MAFAPVLARLLRLLAFIAFVTRAANPSPFVEPQHVVQHRLCNESDLPHNWRHERFQIPAACHSLDLGGRGLGDEGAAAIAVALKGHEAIKWVQLVSNSIGEKGAAALAEALKANKVLTSLNLWWNSIGDEGAEALAEALESNKYLTGLSIGNNSIGDYGAEALARALKVNRVLTSLDVQWNSIGDEGAGAMAEALKSNRMLSSLDLSVCSIGERGSATLVEALQRNMVITRLDLQDNDVGFENTEALSAALDRNKAARDATPPYDILHSRAQIRTSQGPQETHEQVQERANGYLMPAHFEELNHLPYAEWPPKMQESQLGLSSGWHWDGDPGMVSLFGLSSELPSPEPAQVERYSGPR